MVFRKHISPEEVFLVAQRTVKIAIEKGSVAKFLARQMRVR
jgi:hypothetical protein